MSDPEDDNPADAQKPRPPAPDKPEQVPAYRWDDELPLDFDVPLPAPPRPVCPFCRGGTCIGACRD